MCVRARARACGSSSCVCCDILGPPSLSLPLFSLDPVQVQLTAGQVPYAQHYGIAEKPLSIKGYLGAMDKYLPRLTAVLDQHTETQRETERQSEAQGEEGSAGVRDQTRLLVLRRLLSNQSAIDALRCVCVRARARVFLCGTL